MSVDPGKMDRFIKVLEPVVVKNAYGEETTTYRKFAHVWASKEDKTGIENNEGVQLVAKSKVIWTTYYLQGIHERMKIQYGNEMYDIDGPPKELGYKAYWEIVTERKDSD